MATRIKQPIEAYSPKVLADTRPMYHAHSALGVIGHIVKTAGVLAPLIIGEFIKDAEKRWRWTRISSVATALLWQGLYANTLHQERRSFAPRGR